MENKPEVSVIVNCFNSQEYLKEALGSVFAQTYKDWEIIFWDDASTDNSFKIAESYGEKARCFSGKKAQSLGQARNMAIKQARGGYLAFLDSDDIWLPEKLEKQMAIFKKNPQVGLVFSDVMYFNKKGNIFSAYQNKKPPIEKVFGKLLKKNFLCVSSVVIKKEALLRLDGWFDERFTGIEDWDLFLRISHDWKAEFVDDVLVKYRMHQKSWTSLNQSAFPKEQKLMVKKFLKLYPGFYKNYWRQTIILSFRATAQKIIIFFSWFFPKPLYGSFLKFFKIKNYSS